MIKAFLDGHYDSLKLVHVPMRFSRSTSEIGSFSLRKLLVLMAILLEIIAKRFSSGATILYYPPAGANLTPVLRDLFLLIPTRFLFGYTVFHFHAAGLSGIYSRLPRVLRPLYRLAYNDPDLAIFTTAATSAESQSLRAKRSAIIPCGIPDNALETTVRSDPATKVPSILFAGILCEEKGVLVLLEACRQLTSDGLRFHLTCIGAFQSADFKIKVEALLKQEGLEEFVHFPGVITGKPKDELFSRSDIFCFPSHYPAESFGVVLIEAMSFSLPIVATDWQGIPEVVGQSSDKANPPGALLVPPRDAPAVAAALGQLIRSPQLRSSMGKHNRARYLEHFTLAKYRSNLETALTDISADTCQTASRTSSTYAQEPMKKMS